MIDCKGKQRVILLPAVADAVSDAVLPEAADCERQYLCHKKRAGSPQTECVGGHEIRLRRSRCSSEQGIPHNLRHLFAKIFYERDHDLVRLADYLGHSSVETTRRYTIISSREACRRQLELGLLIDRET